MEGGVLVLRHLLHLAVELGSGCLVDAAALLEVAGAHGLEHPQHSGGVHVGRELGRVEADLHMALRGQVVDFVGSHLVDDLHDRHGVAEVGIMQMEAGMTFEMRYPLAVVHRAAADDAVYVIALFKKEFGKIRTVLTGHAGDQCNFSVHCMMNIYLRKFSSSG